MDPFTQSMLHKAEKRAAALGISGSTKFPLQEYNQEPPPKRESPRKPKPIIKPTVSPRQKTNTIIKQTHEVDAGDTDTDVKVEINITTRPNVQLEFDVKECEIDAQGNVKEIDSGLPTEAKAAIRDSSKNQLQRLGALYSETQDLSSPIHRTEGRFHEEIKENSKPKQKLAKLAMLADSINNWEDDTSHPDYRHHRETIYNTDSPKKSGAIPKKYPAPPPPKSILSPVKKDAKIEDNMDKTTKQLKWDQKVMDALESQGFQRRESTNPKLVYEYKEEEKNNKGRAPDVPDTVPKTKIEQRPAPNPPAVKKPEIANKGLVSGRAALFEANKNSRKSLARNQKDPAEMSLKERMAIFEKNKGTALVPKAAFGMAAPIKAIEKSSFTNDVKIGSYNKPALAESKASGSGIKNAVAALMSGGQTIAETNIAEETKRQRQEEMDQLLNRFNKHIESNKKEKEIPAAPPMPPSNFLSANKSEAHKRRSSDSPNDSPEVRSALEDVKRIRVQPPKNGRLYPVLSDIESEADNYTTATVSESEDNFNEKKRISEDSFIMDSDDGICNLSLGREILQAVQMNESKGTKTPKRVSINTGSLESSVSEISEMYDDMDDYLEEALEDSEESDTPKKGSISSNSFSYQKNPQRMHCHTIDEEESDDHYAAKPIPKEDYCSPVRSELTVNNSDDNNMVTLVHTVSFYRRQQHSQNNTPIRKVFREQKFNQESTTEDSDDGSSTSNEENALVQEKIKKLQTEIAKQVKVIQQTSQALNLCASTIEFSGSAESVEGERHLLVATHRHRALKEEVSRLQIEQSLRPSGAPNEKGQLTIKDITVPLKQDYLKKLASETISGHQLVCLLKYNENVLATRTVPTMPGLLSVQFPDVLTLNNVYADFKITMEIYGMTAQREILPHEVKYHIGMPKKNSKLLTPKSNKNSKTNSRLFMPHVQSAGGPDVVRTPALVQYGFIIFSFKEIQRTSWTLNPVSGISPLEGSVHMKVNCELTVTVDYRGFLTMFEDISGFGAWHRRWCRLNGHVLSYWKYPDDEKKKTPIGSINLQNICTHKVTVAPRDVCARLNTLLLESKRPSHDSDVESLVLVKKGNTTVVRYLLSADSKEEREEWSAHLNKTLALLRAWGQSAQNSN